MFPERSALFAMSLTALSIGPLPALAETQTHFAPEAELKTDAGYNSNVFRLSDSLGAEGGMFTDLDAKLTAEGGLGKRWQLDTALDLAARFHESSLSDGDESQYRLRIGGEREPASHRGVGFEWAFAHTLRDSTYVSRSTGQVAQSGGVQIGNRFDSRRTSVDARVVVPFARHTRGLFNVTAENKDYRNDYESLGLDRLDSVTYGIEPGFAFHNRKQEVDVSVPLSLRRYSDRRANDVLGIAIPGSDLQYRYLGIGVRYEYELTRQYALKAHADFQDRSDNEQGYADSTKIELGVAWIARSANNTHYSLEATWSAREYDRIDPASQQLNEEALQRKGYSLVAQWSGPVLEQKTDGLRLFAEARWSSYRNDTNDLFSYDGYQALAGLRKTVK